MPDTRLKETDAAHSAGTSEIETLTLLITAGMIIIGFLFIAFNMWAIGLPDWKFFKENLLATIGTSFLTIGFVSLIFGLFITLCGERLVQ